MLKERVLTAVVAVAILLSVLFYAPETLARVVIGLLFVAAAWEWSQFLGSPSVAVRGAFVLLVIVGQIVLAAAYADLRVYAAVLYIAIAWWSAALVWTFRFPTPITPLAAWICGLLVLLPAYLALDWLYLTSPWLLLAVLVLVWVADIGAYFTGRSLGRVKLAPRVSPGKTWEGVLGGLALSLAAAAIVAIYVGEDLLVVLPFCAAAILISVVGDLTVSMFKRHSGLKDSGRLFPGHGGVLDRVDSICAAAPVFAAGTKVFGLA